MSAHTTDKSASASTLVSADRQRDGTLHSVLRLLTQSRDPHSNLHTARKKSQKFSPTTVLLISPRPFGEKTKSQTCNTSTKEDKAGESEFEANLGFIVRSYLKTTKRQQQMKT